MKVAISLPNDLYERAEQASRQLGLNRSQFYAKALASFVENIGPDLITEQLDEIADEHAKERTLLGSSATARSMIDAGGWEW